MSGIVRVLIVLGVTSAVALAGTTPKVVVASLTVTPPVIDGLLSEEVWRHTSNVGDFTQFDPNEGAAPTESTAVYVLFDDNALYVGVRCFDSNPADIVGQMTRRDRSSEADRFTVMIDSYHDQQTGFVFSTNVSGIQSDGVLSQDGKTYDITWDAVWDVKTTRTEYGWSAEFAIPFNALRFSPDDSAYVWGVNFRRYISRKKETDEWVMVPRSERVQIARWGHLLGLHGIASPLHLEVMPYVSAGGTFRSDDLPTGPTSEFHTRAGVDLKYGLSRNFTLDASVYPDFGQVEVDQAVLNLTVFEPYFLEKRAFFIEGAQMFTFGATVDNTSLPLFFSRRIGRTPSASYAIAAPAGGGIDENPLVTDILGAVKLSGRSASGLSMGVLAAGTDRAVARVHDSTNVSTTMETEPRSLYAVARVKQDLGGTSWVGLMGTAVGRHGSSPVVSGGADWSIRFSDGVWTWDGYLAGANSGGVTDGGGAAGKFLISRISAEHWFTTASIDCATRRFNPNDLGYFARPRDFGGYWQLIYRENFASGLLYRYGFSFVPSARWNWDHVRSDAVVEAAGYADFKNFWEVQIYYRLHPPSFEDEQRGIVGLRKRPSAHEIELIARTDDRRDAWAMVDGDYTSDAHGGSLFAGTLSLTLRPSPWMELAPFVFIQRNRKEIAWLFPDGNIVDPAISPKEFTVFGDRALDEVDVGLRGIVTFSRTLSLQWFAQVLLARGRYASYSRLDASGELIVYDYAASTSFVTHDFDEATLNANILLRWEYLPGSTFYLAWTQERSGAWADHDRTLDRSFNDTFALPQQNVLLAKATYWFGL